MSNNKLDIKSLESWLWEAACKIRGPVDAPKYKDYILPLIFLKRLSDVFEDELERLAQNYGSKETVEELLAQDHKLVRFYLPKNARWEVIAKHTTQIGE
ncbi:MAG TPA: type I restriction-modification system subunit M N-terminal domain-containing protein, partial [Candidatus Marinimicrobia bacterium]|nr:type I restriction-modification system subunit M N-terminal domain-containing protein [Candidatus Neomarinimicrobiota bacterium]